MGTTGGGLLRPVRKASARIQGLKRGGSRFSKLGGLENRCNSTSRRDVPSPLAALGAATFRSPPGRAAPGPSGLPTGNGGVQKFDLFRVELAATVLLPLGMHPHAEGVL